jgi:hypothetical protein
MRCNDVELKPMNALEVGRSSVIDTVPAKKWDHSNRCPVAAAILVNILSRYIVKRRTTTQSIYTPCTSPNTSTVLRT